ncbi:uncharacterized protein BDW47DRAFT_84701 [Aspergillus candidus]|uniref:Transmembrane protein n=1 Tax=Aspergillus candidus TaxID=41067 RepID=A0A2I2F077_ASPCN|nr:hypothetical protein BDW47DRAFT_84701 [Aspergillus candidus]PLB34022.1 hypothetical protein BDW47DRAFT_84701 [Aspergillus candidus]
MATPRLRKAFRYPDDSDDDEQGRAELDDEEQESVLDQLRTQIDQRNAEYSNMFAIVPLLSTIIFVPQLLAGSSRALEPLLALLGIASLITTAYIMKYMPLRKTDSRFTQAALKPEAPTSILEYLLLANIIVSGLLTVSYVFLPRVESSLSHRQVTYVVPGVMLVIVFVVRRLMVSVNIEELEKLRYDYKGA